MRWPAVLLVALSTMCWAVQASPIKVIVYQGGFASVNSYIFSNGRSLVVMDVQRKASEATKLAQLIKSQHLPLTHILISHGHTDHFTGMAVLHHEFPDAQIVVANEDIKRDIKEYAMYMDTGGATGAEPALDPALKPRSAAHPAGFDYDGLIQVLPGETLDMAGGGRLELDTHYPPTEAKHMTTVYCHDLNGLFLADLAYNKVHLWLGDDITMDRISVWRSQLLLIKQQYASVSPTVYPGHGDSGNLGLLDEIVRYIDDFRSIASRATSRDAAWTEMNARYPGYREADFFLKYSVANHVK